MIQKSLILGSSSIDRKNLLESLKIDFKIIISEYEEVIDEKISPEKLAMNLAETKLNKIFEKIEELKKKDKWKSILNQYFIIITADTIVYHNGTIIGKAKNKNHAFEILKTLSGKMHELITGFTVYDSETNEIIKDYSKTQVFFKNLSDEEILDYINNSNEYFNRAGAYSLRERASLFISEIRGSSSNVIGLPLEKIYEVLKKFKFNILKIKEKN